MPSGSAVGPVLGPFQSPATSLPRVSSPAKIVNAHNTVNAFLATQLGSGLERVQNQAVLQGASRTNLVANKVLSQPFIHSILSRQDTYTLLGSSTSSVGGGSLSGVYSDTGPIVADALKTARARPGPNAPRSVPGLRLVTAFGRENNFAGAQSTRFLHAFRVAVDRGVFTLSQRQSELVALGYSQFQAEVSALDQAGAFTPSAPIPAPILHKGPLSGTLTVSLGALRALTDVDPALTGLQLPGVGNLPGRIDVGYVFDRAGNFGIALTARGPLSDAPKGEASADVIDGDLRVEVSNAPNLAALNGLRTVEAITQGAALAGGLEATTNANNVSTFAASVGYGSGLEFGTGKAYTRVIPLGNVYSLIPEFPKR